MCLVPSSRSWASALPIVVASAASCTTSGRLPSVSGLSLAKRRVLNLRWRPMFEIRNAVIFLKSFTCSFLRGECTKPKCLLSHNVTLEKMPVCRYYLRGVCVREDCPYLHKKLSSKTEICIDFVRGYCPLAAEVNRSATYFH